MGVAPLDVLPPPQKGGALRSLTVAPGVARPDESRRWPRRRMFSRGADRQLYRAGVQLFIHEMEKLESTFQVKVLCDEQREMLLEGILS